MSKSHQDPRSRILLTDSADEIRAKVKAAFTDSDPNVTYDPETRPGVSNLLEIYSHLDPAGHSPETIALSFQGKSMRSLKEAVADCIIESLGGVRERYLEIYSSTERLAQIAAVGADNARNNSRGILHTVQESLGLK